MISSSRRVVVRSKASRVLTHQKVVELHGGLDRVRCLSCGERTGRLPDR
jgi:NAD-dependent SIR2 family protein deacetylase